MPLLADRTVLKYCGEVGGVGVVHVVVCAANAPPPATQMQPIAVQTIVVVVLLMELRCPSCDSSVERGA